MNCTGSPPLALHINLRINFKQHHPLATSLHLETVKLINQLNNWKACGTDLIPPELLKVTLIGGLPPLGFLFMHINQTVQMPKDWIVLLLSLQHKAFQLLSSQSPKWLI